MSIEVSLKLPTNSMDNLSAPLLSDREAINYHLSQALELSKRLCLTDEEMDLLKLFRALDIEKKKVAKTTLNAMR